MEHQTLAGAAPACGADAHPSDALVRAVLGVLADSVGVYACIRDARGRIIDFRILDGRGDSNGDAHVGGASFVPADLLPRAEGRLFEAYCEVFTTGQPMHRVEAYRRVEHGDDRAVRWYELRASRDADLMVVLWRDVTDRQRSTETFYRLIDDNPFGLYVVDADFRLARVSRGAQKVFEHVHPLLGRDFAEVLRVVWTEPFASLAIERFRHTLATGEATLRRARSNGATTFTWSKPMIGASSGSTCPTVARGSCVISTIFRSDNGTSRR